MFWFHVIYISVIVCLLAAIVGLLLMGNNRKKEIGDYDITNTGISPKPKKPPVPRYTFQGTIKGGHTFTVLGFNSCSSKEIMEIMDDALDENFEEE